MRESNEYEVRRVLGTGLCTERVRDVQVHSIRRSESHGGVHKSDFH